MPKILTIQDYLSADELEMRYKHTTNSVERSHWHCLWLLACGLRIPQVATTTAYSASWIRQLVHRYNELGPTAMPDQRLKLPGAKPLLSSQLQTQLNLILQQPPPDLGLWTGPKVAAWISGKIDRKVANQRGWDYLKRLGYSLQQPRPHHVRADEQAQVEFKKTTYTSSSVTKSLSRSPS